MGKLFVISGASGVGKSTVLKKVMSAREDLQFSVSATTRPPRPGEEEGVHYYFVSKETFEQMIREDAFVEYDAHMKNYYGTPKAYVDEKLGEGKNVILEIEVQGAVQVKKLVPDAVMIFIAPESREILRARLAGRGTETEDVINKRMAEATNELSFAGEYQYLLENDTVENAVKTIKAIIKAENSKIERCTAELIAD